MSAFLLCIDPAFVLVCDTEPFETFTSSTIEKCVCCVGGSYGRKLEERAAVQRSCRVGKTAKRVETERESERERSCIVREKRSVERRPFKSCWATTSSVAVGDGTFLSFVCLSTRGGFDYDFQVSRDSCRVIETGLVKKIGNPI